MILIKTLKLRNFLSVGAVEQTIDFNSQELTLILGENLDLGGNDNGSRNGVGKTAILQGLSYGLFGTAINTIKKDNLINRTNEKNMSVTIEFSVGEIDYKIVRTRKPNSLKFYVNDKQTAEENDSQGDSRETQEAIERILRMSNTMFNQITGLNTYTTPFLSLKVSEQREVIEQLLGITLLSEKADALKELNKEIKDAIKQEEFRIKGVEEANKQITTQIDSLKRRRELWQKKYDSDLAYLVGNYERLTSIDIDAELLAHKDLAIYNEKKKQEEAFQSILARQSQWKNKISTDIAELERKLVDLSAIDIAAELQAHKDLAAWQEKSKKITELRGWITRCEADEKREQRIIDQLKAEVEELKNHKCYACGQDFHDANHESVLAEKTKALQEASLQALATNTQYIEHTSSLEALGPLGDKPTTHFKTEAEAVRLSSELENIATQIEAKMAEKDPYEEQVAEHQTVELGVKPTTHYSTEQEAITHKTQVAHLETQLVDKHGETDPYSEQIADMEKTAIQVVDFDEINSLNRQFAHQDYLLDLLTNKKSFVRKRIISQNLTYLNARLTHYLTAVGLPHQVVFQDDLSVEITELGRDLDFDNLSRGERTRVILALSLAFRDVYESLYSPINLVFIDELLDNGLDQAGLENSLAILKDMNRKRNKSIFVVSHRDELINRVSSILKVVKENGFTSFAMADEE
jgi:DNA repair exonuclease SbcCD ATPase subunit